jgi:hypothetical protein
MSCHRIASLGSALAAVSLTLVPAIARGGPRVPSGAAGPTVPRGDGGERGERGEREGVRCPSYPMTLVGPKGRRVVELGACSSGSAPASPRTFVHGHGDLNPRKVPRSHWVVPLSSIPLAFAPNDRVTFVARDGYAVSIAAGDLLASDGFFGVAFAEGRLGWRTHEAAPFLGWSGKGRPGRPFHPSDDAWWIWWVRAVFLTDDAPSSLRFRAGPSEPEIEIDMAALGCPRLMRAFDVPRGRRDFRAPRLARFEVAACSVESLLASRKPAVAAGRVRARFHSGKELVLASRLGSYEIQVGAGNPLLGPTFGGPLKLCYVGARGQNCEPFLDSITVEP